MIYTTKADIEAMAEAVIADGCGTPKHVLLMILRVALAASPVHAELERLKAENEKLREVRDVLQSCHASVHACYKQKAACTQAIATLNEMIGDE